MTELDLDSISTSTLLLVIMISPKGEVNPGPMFRHPFTLTVSI